MQKYAVFKFTLIRISEGFETVDSQLGRITSSWLSCQETAGLVVQKHTPMCDSNTSGRDYTKQPGLMFILDQIADLIRRGVAPECIVVAFCELDRITRDRRFIAHVLETPHFRQIRWFNASENRFISFDELLAGLDDAAKLFELQSAAAKSRAPRRRPRQQPVGMIGFGRLPHERALIIRYARMYYRKLLTTDRSVSSNSIAAQCIDHLNRHGHRFRRGNVPYTFTQASFKSLLLKFNKHITNDELPCECQNCPHPEIITPDMVQCDTCEGFFHIGCGGAARGHLVEDEAYNCYTCKINNLADVANDRIVIDDLDPMVQ